MELDRSPEEQSKEEQTTSQHVKVTSPSDIRFCIYIAPMLVVS